MKILAIETSTDACSAALAIGDEVHEVYRLAPREHTRLILDMMDEVLAHGGLSLAQVDALAFGRGPGAFTGVRVAVSVAQGAAFGADLPVIPVSSLAALAHYAYRECGSSHVVVATDARLAEVYTGCYRVTQHRAELIGVEQVIKPESLPLIEQGEWCAIGSGWELFEPVLRQRVTGATLHVIAGAFPHAYDIACLARHGERVAAEKALPVYLRDDVTS